MCIFFKGRPTREKCRSGDIDLQLNPHKKKISNDSHNYYLLNNADFSEVIYNRKERKATLIWEYPSKWFLNECKL